jgi:hypothetical protein
MFSSLLRRPQHGTRRVEIRDSSLSPATRSPGQRYTVHRHASADFTEGDDDDDLDVADFGNTQNADTLRGEAVEDGDEDGEHNELPVLPLFSSTHLGMTPFFCRL